jgi:hypothetical protein
LRQGEALFSLRPVSNGQSKTPAPVAWWIVFCAFCNCTGWVLSAVGQLNAAGYGVTFLAGAAAVWVFRKHLCRGGFSSWRWHKARGRWRRTFPLAFLVLAGLAVLGGTLHAPNNYDALAYRLPRVLHWLAADRWYWIHTDFGRLNNRACGIEWLTAPLLAFARSDRFLFLINVVSLLLLPGLVFGVFTRLGVRARVAWHWMWLLPTGYCYLLQAGSIGNDLFGAVFPLAALDFALRARRSQNVNQLWLSILAAALATGSKASNLPLLLPWLIAVMPSVKLLRRRLIPTCAVVLTALLVSVLPVLIMNAKYSGDWSGVAVEHADSVKGTSLLRAANNAVVMTLENLTPPIFPWASGWNRAMGQVEPAAWRAKMETLCEPQSAHWELVEMQMEEGAGLGFGVSLLLLISLATSLFAGGHRSLGARRDPLSTGIILSAFVSLLVFAVKTGNSGPVRLATPYYALLIPAVLVAGSQARVVKTRWWRWAAMGNFALAGLLLILSPARPLWPALTVLHALGADRATQGLKARTWTVYSVYSQRADAFMQVRDLLPRDANPLGFITADDPESALWRPFGSRRILHVCKADRGEQTRQKGIKYVLINVEELTGDRQVTVEQWLKANDAEVLQRLKLRLRAARESSEWLLVKLR